MSVKLTTSLSQRLVLTPQLRQRIEMLQMTSLELSDLIQQQLLENPVLEEVTSHEETQELSEKILDQLAGADPGSGADPGTAEPLGSDLNGAGANGAGDADELAMYAGGADSASPEVGESAPEGLEAGEEGSAEDAPRDAFEEIDF